MVLRVFSLVIANELIHAISMSQSFLLIWLINLTCRWKNSFSNNDTSQHHGV